MKTGRYTHLIEAAKQQGALVEANQEDDIFDQIEREAFEKKIVSSFGGIEKMHAALNSEIATLVRHDDVDQFMVDLHRTAAANVKD